MNALDKFINRNVDKVIEQSRIIEDMLESGRYRYADDTLRSILDFMERTGDVSEAQIQAIENIRQEPSNNYHYGRRKYRN